MTSALVYAVWALLGAALLALWAWSSTDRAPLARPSVVLVRLASGPLLRVVLVVGWMWTGWHLFAR
jgi:hypothetical protein